MAPSREKLLKWFIEDLSDQTLESVRGHPGTVIKDDNFRLDVQGKTTNGQLNLQIQVDAHPTKPSLREWANETVAGPSFVMEEQYLTPGAIRESSRDSSVDFSDKSQQRRKGSKMKKSQREKPEEKVEEPDQGSDKGKQNEKGKKKFGKK